MIQVPGRVGPLQGVSWWQLAGSWGHEIVASRMFTDESGSSDLINILSDDEGRFGYIVVTRPQNADPMLAAITSLDGDWSTVEKIALTLGMKIKWHESAASLADELVAQAHSDNWVHHGDEMNAWLLRISMELRTGSLAGPVQS